MFRSWVLSSHGHRDAGRISLHTGDGFATRTTHSSSCGHAAVRTAVLSVPRLLLVRHHGAWSEACSTPSGLRSRYATIHRILIHTALSTQGRVTVYVRSSRRVRGSLPSPLQSTRAKQKRAFAATARRNHAFEASVRRLIRGTMSSALGPSRRIMTSRSHGSSDPSSVSTLEATDPQSRSCLDPRSHKSSALLLSGERRKSRITTST